MINSIFIILIKSFLLLCNSIFKVINIHININKYLFRNLDINIVDLVYKKITVFIFYKYLNREIIRV